MVLCHGSFPFLYDARRLRGYIYSTVELFAYILFEKDKKTVQYLLRID